MSFQSTRPRGARHPDDKQALLDSMVSIHAPAWGATTGKTTRLLALLEFQSTRPRGARPFPLRSMPALSDVSIHAPAWGATTSVQLPCKVSCVSIHAPAWGATSGSITSWTCIFRFNPRARVGRDARSAVQTKQAASFNPRARVGRDSTLQRATMRLSSFNPRARVGRDPDTAADCGQARCFNPRARVGRDSIVRGQQHGQGAMFQSTRPRGARRHGR